MMCYALTLAAVVVLGQAPTPAVNPSEVRKIDGEWEIVYIEMDGKALKAKDFGNVNIQNNKLSCTHEGKQKSWQLSFQPQSRVRSECLDADTKQEQKHAHGVYIAAKDYLAFSMNHGQGADNRPDAKATTGSVPQNDTPVPQTGDGTRHEVRGSHFVLILRRPNAGNQ